MGRCVSVREAPEPHEAVREMVGPREATEGTPRPHVVVRGRSAPVGLHKATQETLRSHVAVRGRASQAGPREAVQWMDLWGRGTIVGDTESRSRNTSGSVREAAEEEEKGKSDSSKTT